MSSRNPLPWHGTLHSWVLWALIFSLPIYGVAGCLAQWIGAQHYHRAAHSHSHSALQRHHHAAADATVVAVGVTDKFEAADLSATAALAVPIVALASLDTLKLREGLSHAWPLLNAQPKPGLAQPPLERPPKA